MGRGDIMDNLERFYDYLGKLELEGLRETWVGNRFKILYVFQKSLKFLPPRKSPKVLEVGVGEGYLLLLLRKLGFDVYGVDISPYIVEALNRKFSRYEIKVLHGDISDPGLVLKLREDFDAVFALDVLEHIPNLQTALGNIRALLKGEGFLIATLPVGEDPYENLATCPKCGYIFHRWGHVHFFKEPSDVFELLYPYFKIIKWGFVPPHNSIYRILWFLVNIARHLKILRSGRKETLYFIARKR